MDGRQVVAPHFAGRPILFNGWVFTPADRSRIRDELVARAQSDPNVVGAALVGSAARDAEDAWSDIDLVLQLGRATCEPEVVEEWSREIDSAYGVADTLDVLAGGIRYRVFLLRSSLQLDVSFWPHDEFRATEPGFRLLFGTPATPAEPSTPDIDRIIGSGWLYALHARSATARGRLWQAAMMLDELRSQVITLKCLRHGLNPWHGRDVDGLPAEDLAELVQSRAALVEPATLDVSRALLLGQFLDEVRRRDVARADRLAVPFRELASPAAGEP